MWGGLVAADSVIRGRGELRGGTIDGDLFLVHGLGTFRGGSLLGLHLVDSQLVVRGSGLLLSDGRLSGTLENHDELGSGLPVTLEGVSDLVLESDGGANGALALEAVSSGGGCGAKEVVARATSPCDFGSFRLGARILELRQEGLAIVTEMVETANGKHIARYSLALPEGQVRLEL